jgi:AcrR family transcriptional regulator
MGTPRRDVARTRLHILEAARSLVAAGETPALNTVAHAADVGVGTVYRHFATVAELEEALVWDRFDALATLLRQAGPEHLDQALSAHFRLLVEDSLFEKVVSRRETALERTTQLQTALIEDLGTLMQRAAALGHLRPDVGPGQVLLLLCGIAHAARMGSMASDDPDSSLMLQVVLEGLRPDQAGTGHPVA